MGLFLGSQPIEILSGIVVENDASNIKYNSVANAINVQEDIDKTIVDNKVALEEK